MPATRRARTSGGPATKGAQSTLSFGNRSKVTKPSSAVSNKEKAVISLDNKARETKSADLDLDADAGLVAIEVVVEKQTSTELAAPKTEVEKRAEKVTDAQIKNYWKAREAERSSGRVHQEGMTVEEKILRLFDMSSQYGPCIGVTRMKRWKRADKLHLNPPVEVLAVLLKEEAKGNRKIEIAHVDELMGSKAVAGEA